MDLINKAFAAPSITNLNCPSGGNYSSGILKGLPCDKPVEDMELILTAVKNVTTNVLLPAAGVLFVIMIILGGLQYIASAGNTQKAEKAKKLLTAAIIGLFLVVLAEVIIGIFVSILGGGVG